VEPWKEEEEEEEEEEDLILEVCVESEVIGTCEVVPLLKHHVKKTYEGVEVDLHSVLTSALDGG
jgi:hypothetical protein